MVSLLSGVQFLKEFGVFTVVLPFLLVFAITYGILSYVKPFGDDKVLNAVLSFVVSFMALQFMPVLVFVQTIIPYIFALFLIVFLVILLFRFMGVKEDLIQEAFSHPAVYGVIIAVLIIGIFIFISESFPELSVSTQQKGAVSDSLGGVYTGELETGSEQQAVSAGQEGDGPVIVTYEEDIAARQNLLRNTIFHPTILSVLIMFIVFGVAAYMITVVKEA